MKLLLDTHTFLWLVEGNPNLSSAAQTALADPANELFLAELNLWGIVLGRAIDAYQLAIKGSALFDGRVNPCGESNGVRVAATDNDPLVFRTLIVQLDEIRSVIGQHRPVNVLRYR